MSANNRIFRQSALDKLASPEQLDQLMQVTTPKGWLALGGALVLVLTAVAWSVFGTVATQVSGRGILIRPGGVLMVSAHGDGTIQDILVESGQTIVAGQVIAKVLQPELEIRLRQAGLMEKHLGAELAQLRQEQDRERAAEEAIIQKQREAYTRILADKTLEIEALKLRVQAEEKLKEAGIETELQLLEARVAHFNTEHELALAKVQLEQIDVTWLQSEQRRQQALLAKQMQHQESVNQAELSRALYELNGGVVSPYSGEVLEIIAKEGQRVGAHAPVLTVQSTSALLEGRLYLSAADGKRVRTNMLVHLNPVSVKKEEHGLLLGTVTSVSAFPATPQAMLSRLENSALVNEFSQGGAPIEVQVALEATAETPNGFRWTSVHGPPEPLTSGTLCQGTITLARRRPISLFLPVWREEVRP